MNPISVPPFGATDAPVGIIGEAPGQEEVREGKGFVGPAGWELWRVLKHYGIREEMTWRTNAVWTNPGKFPIGKRGAMLMKAWAPFLDRWLEQTSPKVLLLVGGVALQRMTGLTGIGDWTGSVLRKADIREKATWYESKKEKITHNIILPPSNPIIIPMLHTSGVIRDPARKEVPLLYAAARKVARVLDGTLETYKMVTHFRPDPREMWEAFEGAEKVYFDTEFNPETGELYWFGATANGVDVWGCPWSPDYVEVVRKIVEMDAVKGAHNIAADWRVLGKQGLELRGKLFCSMLGAFVLRPGLNVGLSPVSRLLLDDVKHTKWMDKNDPYYNAQDVQMGWWCMDKIEREAKRRPVSAVGVMERRFGAVRVGMEMEDFGLLVDERVRGEMREGEKKKIEELEKEIERDVMVYWDKKVRAKREVWGKFKAMKDAAERLSPKPCEKHPTYDGLRKVRAKKCEVCEAHFEKMEEFRKKYTATKASEVKARKELKELEEGGFKLSSPQHLAWLLYSSEGLGLPIQKNFNTGKKTTGKDAIERLSKLKTVQKKKGAFEVVRKIKTAQESGKAISTFIDVEVDERGYAHPPCKIHGTITGRPASGEDKTGELDKARKEGTFNAFNIPERWRRMYVAPKGFVIVHGDWKNQEGRCVAWRSGDRKYLEMFREEDSGGHDVHSLTAALVYGVEPEDARKVMVKVRGSEHSARFGGKMGRHAWSYTLTPVSMMVANYQLERGEAERIVGVLDGAHPGVVRKKEEDVRVVLGRWEPVNKRTARCVEKGTRYSVNPFGWQLEWFGMGTVRKREGLGWGKGNFPEDFVAYPAQAKDLLAWYPQSMGADMWMQDAPLLRERYKVYTGTYDSFSLLVPDSPGEVKEAVEFMKRVMERPREEMDGFVFPVEVAVGRNLGKWSRENVDGLKEVV